MLLTFAAALALLAAAPAAQEGDDARPRVASSTPSRALTARAPSLPQGPTRTVCGRERVMDSNIQRRVCRQVPVNSAGRELMSGDYLRQMQSIGLDSTNGPNPRQPGGRPVG